MILMVASLLISSQLHADKIYKWVDENGQIHYSSQKPRGQQVETVKVQKGPKVSEVVAETSDSDEENDDPVNSSDSEADAAAKAQLAKADAVNMRKMCEQARKNIAALNATVRVVQIDEKTGETIRMTDNQRLEAMKTAQQGVREFCK